MHDEASPTKKAVCGHDGRDMRESGPEPLRGFDAYSVSLGDELRGERASMGKSLLDVQRELRIKAAHIDAIENADPDAIPYRGFVAGYVRAYARYLSLDEELVLRRFCDEAGFDPAEGAPAPARETRRADDRARRKAAHDVDAIFAGSRLAAASRAASYNASVGATLRMASSVAVMATLVGGLGYGAWSVLESIQRVGFSPSPEAPRALLAAPGIAGGPEIAQAGVAPMPVLDPAALAAVYADQETPPPPFEQLDGPISALDPASSGVYAGRAAPESAEASTSPAAAAVPLDPAFAPALASVGDRVDAGAAAEAAPAAPPGVTLGVREAAWVRVRDAAGRVAHEALMAAGDRWSPEDGREGYTLRAGNAGGVFLQVGAKLYGPLGRPGGVVSNIQLDAEAVRRVFAVAEAAGAAPEAGEPLAAAALTRR